MHIQIDQSPRIENWTKHSVIAFSNSQEKAVILTSQLKREALAVLLERGVTESTAKWMLFSAGIVILVRYHLTQITHITIDLEFDRATMHQICNWIFQKFMREWREQKIAPPLTHEDITFASIGKKSPAHELAYRIYTEKGKPQLDIRIKRREFLALIK